MRFNRNVYPRSRDLGLRVWRACSPLTHTRRSPAIQAQRGTWMPYGAAGHASKAKGGHPESFNELSFSISEEVLPTLRLPESKVRLMIGSWRTRAWGRRIPGRLQTVTFTLLSSRSPLSLFVTSWRSCEGRTFHCFRLFGFLRSITAQKKASRQLGVPSMFFAKGSIAKLPKSLRNHSI